ncbi:2'-5' RNA ligase family protein [Phycicoccus duodecadis]|uniref:2'-5' RNA ligase n=1 Tax=Phycicoccus duodecadis TaxID=173053 RepID=A0A2N3YM56_9MICO|nr:hypothetical protein [Phycicoccus duodecadis]PKW27940.1 2'-5' RNA ligase [Phycicoccus duodecadis]
MQVSVALVPPEGVVNEIEAIIDGTPGARAQLDVVPTGALRLPLIGLGNLTRPDVEALCEHLVELVAGIGMTPRIGLAGAVALESPDDPTVSLGIVGDVDGMIAVAKALPPMVSDFGFYVDRRRFVPKFTVARVTAGTTLPVLQALVDKLERYRSREWDLEGVEVLSRVHRDDGAIFERVHTLYTS